MFTQNSLKININLKNLNYFKIILSLNYVENLHILKEWVCK